MQTDKALLLHRRRSTTHHRLNNHATPSPLSACAWRGMALTQLHWWLKNCNRMAVAGAGVDEYIPVRFSELDTHMIRWCAKVITINTFDLPRGRASTASAVAKDNYEALKAFFSSLVKNEWAWLGCNTFCVFLRGENEFIQGLLNVIADGSTYSQEVVYFQI